MTTSDPAAAPPDERAELAEELRLARRELKLVRDQQDSAAETLQGVRRQRAALRTQVDACSEALARLLSQQYWQTQRGGLRGAAGRLRPSPEQEMVAEVEAAPEFDGGWYLRHNLDAVAELLSPAVHYLRTGGPAGRDPGPRFDTARYLREHPDARGAGVAPLVHLLRVRRG